MRSSVSTISFLIVSLAIQSVSSEFFPDERDALIQLRDIVNASFNLHGNWTGPPCRTANESRWAGIACSYWHVAHLVLEGIQLTGSLPSTFLRNLTFLSKLSFRNNSLRGPLPDLTNLVHLEFVFLSRNQFSGSIPTGYIDLPNLTELELQENVISGQIPPFDQQTLTAFNVSNNKLEGPVPETPVLSRFSKSSYDNNHGLCGEIAGLSPCPDPPPPVGPVPPPTPPPVPSTKKGGNALKIWSIALISAAAALVPIFVVLVLLCCYRRVYGKRRKQEQQQLPGTEVSNIDHHRAKVSHWDDPEKPLELEFLAGKPTFDLDDLLRAASEVIGKGKMGTTYKAMLELGPVVTVKRLKDVNSLSKKEFAQQMHLLGNMTKHENLAEIISFYYSKEEKLIVYEYVAGDSLFSLLHENRGTGRRALAWKTRVSIIRDVATALDFLHNRLPSQRSPPHANLNSSNVLIKVIDHDHVHVKLTDYGFLPLVPNPADKLAVSRTPEFRQGKKLTTKADVYCFGVLVLEIVTGKVPPPLSSMSGSGSEQLELDLSGWVREAVNIDWSTDILDAEILGEKEGYDEMLKLTEIALECTDEVPERRPKVSQVLSRIVDELCSEDPNTDAGSSRTQ